MGERSLIERLEQADREGWQSVFNSAPEPGVRVDVMHIMNRTYDTDGEVDEAGEWLCRNGFILPNMTITLQPTHWRPRSPSIPSARG